MGRLLKVDIGKCDLCLRCFDNLHDVIPDMKGFIKNEMTLNIDPFDDKTLNAVYNAGQVCTRKAMRII